MKFPQFMHVLVLVMQLFGVQMAGKWGENEGETFSGHVESLEASVFPQA